jgi:hypothetical protein
MPIQAVFQGRVVDGPFEGGDDQVTTFTFGDTQTGLYQYHAYEINNLKCCDVICRGPLAANVLAGIHEGDNVIIAGELRMSLPLDAYDDRQLVHLRVEAQSVGVDVTTPRQRGPESLVASLRHAVS